MKKFTLKYVTTLTFFIAFAFVGTLFINNDALAKISPNEAKHIALRHSGVEAKRATFQKVDYDSGRHGGTYEVKFHTPNRRFEYTISARDGKVLNSSQNKRDKHQQPQHPPRRHQ